MDRALESRAHHHPIRFCQHLAGQGADGYDFLEMDGGCRMEGTADARTSWPQTVLHVLGAGILILPLIFLTGMLMVAIDVLDGLRNGRGLGDSIGFVLRGLHYAIAAGCSLLLPRMVLKRSHAVVAAGLAGLIGGTILFCKEISPNMDARDR